MRALNGATQPTRSGIRLIMILTLGRHGRRHHISTPNRIGIFTLTHTHFQLTRRARSPGLIPNPFGRTIRLYTGQLVHRTTEALRGPHQPGVPHTPTLVGRLTRRQRRQHSTSTHDRRRRQPPLV